MQTNCNFIIIVVLINDNRRFITICVWKNTGIFKTKIPAVAWIADHTGCQWLSGSSKINDSYLICQGVCHFLL